MGVKRRIRLFDGGYGAETLFDDDDENMAVVVVVVVVLLLFVLAPNSKTLHLFDK